MGKLRYGVFLNSERYAPLAHRDWTSAETAWLAVRDTRFIWRCASIAEIKKCGMRVRVLKKRVKLNPYQLIHEHYADRCAARSGVPLINHIEEGVAMLRTWHAGQTTIDAFCLHPCVQNGIEPESAQGHTLRSMWPTAYDLAFEYRKKANAYLCSSATDWVSNHHDVGLLVVSMSEQCRLMLLADKIHNQKDFEIHHGATHPRRSELRSYFFHWISYLRLIEGLCR